MNIELTGSIDSSNALHWEETIREQLEGKEGEPIILDAASLEYISSAGLRVLLRIKKKNPEIRLINASPEVYAILDMTGFTEIMQVEKAYRVVSVEGCEKIGQGSNGTIYRIDKDNVVKVYKNADALQEDTALLYTVDFIFRNLAVVHHALPDCLVLCKALQPLPEQVRAGVADIHYGKLISDHQKCYDSGPKRCSVDHPIIKYLPVHVNGQSLPFAADISHNVLVLIIAIQLLSGIGSAQHHRKLKGKPVLHASYKHGTGNLSVGKTSHSIAENSQSNSAVLITVSHLHHGGILIHFLDSTLVGTDTHFIFH